MKEREAWSHILNGALAKAVELRAAPVSGARLRPLVNREAEAVGKTFPPEAGLKLGAFLLLFPDVALVLQREGMDFLAVPAQRPELLLAGRDDAFIRKDFFDAFTRVVSQQPWYAVDSDAVLWLEGAGARGAGLIPMPGTTLEREIAARREFALGIVEQSTRNVLVNAIEQPLPLKRFSEAVHASGLQTVWRKSRTLSVLRDMQSWAAQHQLSWQPTWFREPVPHEQSGRVQTVTTAASVTTASATSDISRRDLAHGLIRLSDEDLARIMIPMDLVLKLLDRR